METCIKVVEWKLCGNNLIIPKGKNNMVQEYKGPYQYSDKIVGDWDSNAIGIYYCGYPSNNTLSVLYVGKGVGDAGIRGRLLDHLRDDYWPDATHFGFCVCGTVKEAEDFEASEIKRLQPKYNKQGK